MNKLTKSKKKEEEEEEKDFAKHEVNAVKVFHLMRKYDSQGPQRNPNNNFFFFSTLFFWLEINKAKSRSSELLTLIPNSSSI